MSPAPDRILPGVALMIGFCIIAPLIDVFAKLASQDVSVGTVTVFRFVVQGALMLPVVLAMRLRMAMTPRVLQLALLRAAVSILSTYTFVAAVQVMPIADALAIVFVEPFIILLIARFAMAEQVGWRRLGACAVGFAGSLLVIQPSFAEFGLVALYPLGTALFFALYILITRQLSRHMHPVTMQLHTALIAAAMCLPLLAIGGIWGVPSMAFDPPQGVIWIWLAGVGVAATISHMSMTYALKFAPSSTLAPLHYLEITSASLFGYLVFGDFPDALKWTGIAIIVASGLYIIYREHALSRATRLGAARLPQR